MAIIRHNQLAWDKKVESGNRWTVPVSSEEVYLARQGNWQIYLTPNRPVPRDWFPDLEGRDVLCLASGGGQQGPILAAVGARVTVFDLSEKQLEQDRIVAERESLEIRLVQGDMQDLSHFAKAQFDLIIHPTSNCFVPDVRAVWQEAYRILKPGGMLFSGFINPVNYCFDPCLARAGIYLVRYAVPYSDIKSLSEKTRVSLYGRSAPLEFGHTLEDQIGGQMDAGFALSGFYEDVREDELLGKYLPTFIATKAEKQKKTY